MDYNKLVTEQLSVLDQITPTSQSAGELLSGAINTKLHRRLFAVIQIGVLGSSATVDATFKASATSGGTYAAVTGAAIVQHTSGNGKVLTIELKMETLAALSVGPFVKLSITVGTAATLTAAVVFGADERYEPASDSNSANVTQQIAA